MNRDKLLEVGIQKRNKQIDLTWQELANQYGGDIFNDGESLRKWVFDQVRKEKNKTTQKNNKEEFNIDNSFKETHEIHKDGSQSSSRLVRMSAEDKKNRKYMLEAHGFDPNEWDLVNVKNSKWTGYSKQDGQIPQYASKITVKPKSNKFSFEMLEKWLKNVKPINIQLQQTELDEKRMLEIPLFDAHFGISDYDYYKPTQNRIYNKLVSRKWEEILFVIGQDLIHNNDFKGNTANGTHIEAVNMEEAWEDARKFYEPLIEKAHQQANRVKIIFSKGNHDETISWAFVKTLAVRFPEALVDTSFIERKAHVFGENFIGITHGDKARKNLHNIFPVEFPELWAKAKNREIHIGHLHTEDSKDWFGMMVRTLSTRNKTDEWHKTNGFVGSHKRFTLFEYSESELEGMYYV